MRPRVSESAKRGTIIGVKADKLTKAQIDYIASANDEATSTYVFNLIREHIEQYTKMTKINWAEELTIEGGKNNG